MLLNFSQLIFLLIYLTNPQLGGWTNSSAQLRFLQLPKEKATTNIITGHTLTTLCASIKVSYSSSNELEQPTHRALLISVLPKQTMAFSKKLRFPAYIVCKMSSKCLSWWGSGENSAPVVNYRGGGFALRSGRAINIIYYD